MDNLSEAMDASREYFYYRRCAEAIAIGITKIPSCGSVMEKYYDKVNISLC